MINLGIDAGNNETKVCGPFGVIKFPSDLSEYRELKLKPEKMGPDDMIWEYNGRKGFAGTLAKYEGEFNGTIKGNTKAHQDTLLRVLLAIHKYCEHEEIRIVVGQPINQHTEQEKAKIKKLLLGMHTITVNDKKKYINISRVEVAAEGGAAFWSAPEMGLIRMLDIGSGTINGATLNDKRYIDKDSFSMNFGANTTKTKDLGAMARAIKVNAYMWDQEDDVRLVGGLAEKIYPYIIEYFPNSKIVYPLVNNKPFHPVYATAVGLYTIARGIYG